MVIQCDTVAHLSLEDPFHAEEGSSDPLGGQQGEMEASIQIQNYVLSGKNTADPPECNSFSSLCIS